MSEDTNIKVAVRCRPFNTKEKNNNEASCVKILPDQIVLSNPGNSSEEHTFAFDVLYDENSKQEEVWAKVGVPILEKAFSGFNGTIFAYGQTGSGKTWSMQGGGEGELRGIIPRMNCSLFNKVDDEKQITPTLEFLVTASYFEIYNELIFDLLDPTDRKKKPGNKGGLEIKEHPVLGVYVKGLQEMVVDNADKLQTLIDQGMKNRTVAATNMNADSSRSHSIFTITVHQKDKSDEAKNVFAKINLVDLAGSERPKSTGASGAILKEGANINKSLSELGNVINALVSASNGKPTFIPYRNSKLTRVLQESLGGNSITVMLAAMSPAACNFEETLSTLRYANRAKAIKVKAVKNEEASQISKLNEEIKLLKEKLAAQSQVSSSINSVPAPMDEKQVQHLKDLEEAMKSTWEAKAKMSEEYEKERKRMDAEQKAAARQLEVARETNWRILEEKNDIDLSIGHVKGISKKHPSIFEKLSYWQSSFRDLLRLEQRMNEEDTVVQVYRSALDKETMALVKPMAATKRESISGFISSPMSPRAENDPLSSVASDKATLSLWRQLKDKISALIAEASKWTSLQEETLSSTNSMRESVEASCEEFKKYCPHETCLVPESDESTQLSIDEFNEIIRGVCMISRQLQEKYRTHLSKIRRNRSIISDFLKLKNDLQLHLVKYENVSEDALQSFASPENHESMSFHSFYQSIVEIREQFSADARQVNHDLEERFRSESPNFSTPKKGSIHGGESKDFVVPIRVECYGNSKIVGNGSNIGLDGPDMWCSVSQSDMDFVEVVLPERRPIEALILQGGIFSVISRSSNINLNNNGKVGPSGSAFFLDFELPTGLKLSHCSGSIDNTVSSLGLVVDWQVFLKKNAPEKLLKRPPVKFLFDLLQHIGQVIPNLFPASFVSASWEQVGSTKQSKIDFMEEAISLVSRYLGIPPITSANNIVIGAEADLTNIFLQQLAILAYWQKSTTSSSTSNDSTVNIEVGSWITKARFSLSDNGENWTMNWDQDLPLSNSSEYCEIPIPNGSFDCKYVRVLPLAWNLENKPESKLILSSIGPSLRLAVRPGNRNLPSIGEEGHDISGSDVAYRLETIRKMASVMILGVELVAKIEEIHKLRKQEEAKKRLEGLADEKKALEQLLLTEKQVLASEKQDLTDQLSQSLYKISELQRILEMEQLRKSQLQNDFMQLEEDKNQMQSSMQLLIDENATLKAELLKLQAAVERDRILIDGLEKTVGEQETKISSMTTTVDEYSNCKSVWDSEKEDLMEQIAILTEERDTARGKEEELYEQLTEKASDLERLQESYVDIADRCNEAQDEANDLREQLESLRNTFSESVLRSSRDSFPSSLPYSGGMNMETNNLSSRSSEEKKPQSSTINVSTSAPTILTLETIRSSTVEAENQPFPSRSRPNSGIKIEDPKSLSGGRSMDLSSRKNSENYEDTGNNSNSYEEDFDNYEDEFENDEN